MTDTEGETGGGGGDWADLVCLSAVLAANPLFALAGVEGPCRQIRIVLRTACCASSVV